MSYLYSCTLNVGVFGLQQTFQTINLLKNMIFSTAKKSLASFFLEIINFIVKTNFFFYHI